MLKSRDGPRVEVSTIGVSASKLVGPRVPRIDVPEIVGGVALANISGLQVIKSHPVLLWRGTWTGVYHTAKIGFPDLFLTANREGDSAWLEPPSKT
jgi:hypothetical protein